MSLIALCITSCDLNQLPNDKITSETAWETVNDAVKFRTGIYSIFNGINGGKHTYASDYQSDLLNATVSFGNRGGDLYRWDFTSAQYDIADIWRYNYECINNCSNIISNIDKITGNNDDETAKLKMIKGEAYLMRAICYHTLVVRFAKDYEPQTAGTELGLPIITVVDPNNKPERSSLADTYTFIKNDIKEARTYLTTVGAANSIYLTADVIDALEARVDLYMHNYTEAVTLAQKIINKYPLLTDKESLANMWLNDEGSEIIFKTFSSVDERTNEYASYLTFNTATGSYQPDFIPTKWVIDLYSNNDIRKTVYFRNDEVNCNDIVDHVYMLNKYPGNPALKKRNEDYYQMHKIFRSAEAYLIAAEAAFKDNKAADALGYLNSLRTKRGDVTANASGDALFTLIKNEWVKEYIGENTRLNDLKRWHEGFQRHSPQPSEVVQAGDQYDSFKADVNNMKFVWEIPANDLKANKNLKPNWGK